MNTLYTLSQNAQRAVCLFFAAVIVASSLSLGAVGTQVAFEHAASMAVR